MIKPSRPFGKIRILTVLGARPQFIKAAAISGEIRRKFRGQIREILVHTGQHFDPEMSANFFRELNLPRPSYHLGVRGGTHGASTGRMLEKIERLLLRVKPDWVLVYGDTNSTLAGSLAAAKLAIPLIHVEAGLRSFQCGMPEEINRVLSDRLATLRFCPNSAAVANLRREGLKKGNYVVGDVMIDLLQQNRRKVETAGVPFPWIRKHEYAFCTLHRAENTAPHVIPKLWNLVCKVSRLVPLVFAVHPRTQGALKRFRGAGCQTKFGTQFPKSTREDSPKGLILLGPQSYGMTQRLLANCLIVLTDSGGLQKEAHFYRRPCLVLRHKTEWNQIIPPQRVVGFDYKKIKTQILLAQQRPPHRRFAKKAGPESASKKILGIVLRHRQTKLNSFEKL